MVEPNDAEQTGGRVGNGGDNSLSSEVKKQEGKDRHSVPRGRKR